MSMIHRLWRPILFVAMTATVACTAQARDPRVEQFAALPDWRGIWFAEGLVADISGFNVADADPSDVPPVKLLDPDAPWNEEGRARLEARMADYGSFKANGWGYPLMMNGMAPLQFLITPEETLVINFYRDVRHVHTDGRPLPPHEDRWPTVWGESIGRWEGDTLVIETVAVEDPSRYFGIAPPLSAQARYTERLRMTGPDRIESQMTITDPETLSRPWVLDLAYTRATGLDRLFHDAYTNDRNELDGDLYTIAPSQGPR